MCASTSPPRCTSVRVVKGVPRPGAQPPGTVFKASARYHGRTYSSSAIWRGTVRPVSRPRVDGRPRVGSKVAAVPARWAGGWATDRNQLAIEACRTRTANGCVMLTGVWLECAQLGCGIEGGVVGDRTSDSSIVVGYGVSGWYLFALDARMTTAASGLVGFSSAAALPPWKTSPIVVRSAPYGPVIGPPGPRVRITPDAMVHDNHVAVASVRCAIRCHVWITVSRTGKHFTSGQRVAWTANKVITGTAMVGVWGSLPSGRVAVQINVGDGPYVRGHTLIGFGT